MEHYCIIKGVIFGNVSFGRNAPGAITSTKENFETR
jgi:hypothetical protein